jgi:hypothetical protein
MITNVSKNITLRQATKSRIAIESGVPNTPGEHQLVNMSNVANNIFEPLIEHFKVPIGILTFYITSNVKQDEYLQYSTGMVMDIDAEVFNRTVVIENKEVILTNSIIFDYIVKNLDYDTIIWQFGNNENPDWIQVSYNEIGNRKRRLSSYKDHENRTQYKYK